MCLCQNVFSLIRLEHLNVNSIIYSGFSVVANDPIFPSQAQWLFKVYEVKLDTQKLHVIWLIFKKSNFESVKLKLNSNSNSNANSNSNSNSNTNTNTKSNSFKTPFQGVNFIMTAYKESDQIGFNGLLAPFNIFRNYVTVN